jgi:hypothetical protein
MQHIAQRLEASFIANCQMDITWVMVGRTTELISVLYCRVRCLDGLLGKRNIPPRNGIQVSFGFDLCLGHFKCSLVSEVVSNYTLQALI